MGLQILANEMLSLLPVNDIKKAAKEYGLTYYYFKQRIKSIDTNGEDLYRAVECMMFAHRDRNSRLLETYELFKKQYTENNKR